ncbi:tyrosine-protein kinase Src64B isoform X2 [Procambarus clarkii]|nr:tyrosine-protein kinase Src64B-like isoform X2 [Procambarus clarkii]
MQLVVGMYSFVARGPSELSFNKGDIMEVLQSSDEDWWLARHINNHNEGFIPVPYIASSSSLECQDWYFGSISRVQAEQLLLSKINTTGAFLIRMSEAGHGYSLSVRTVKDTSNQPRVKHYRICSSENRQFFITRSKAFQTLNDLVDYYLKGVDGSELGKLMRYPCKRPPPGMNDICKDTRDKWEIERSSLQFIKKLGQGSFGDVWLGSWNYDVEVAIKMLKEGTMSKQAFLEEARIMKGLRHPNILVLYAVCTAEEPILIITEYMSEGSLLDMLRADAGHTLSFQEQVYISSQVASGMEYLEAKQLIHRDLAARNVLVGSSLNCKVADFGLARICEGEYDVGPTTKFPVKWTAPEAFLHQYFTIKSDVWSFGVLMMEILTFGAIPYPGMSKQEVIESVQHGYRMGKPAQCPDALYELIYSCWNSEPTNRPTFSYLHDFLENYDVQSERSYYAPPQVVD